MRISLSQVVPLVQPELAGKANCAWGSETQLDSGSFYLVKAPSGTGKSTLISYLYGTRNDFRGRISIDGNDYKTISLKQWSVLRQQKLSVVFQDMRLFPQLTALENIQLKNQLTSNKSVEEIKSFPAQLGIENKLGSLCAHLSLGQQQRVAILRALCQPFAFLLLDEPFSHLDDANIRMACELLKKECEKQNAGLLLTSLDSNYYFDHHHTISV
ncbi:MAG TPA: ATP-binding cassette domain-containing protein [Bacteroidia bacterium]|jgi:ABC-type lipoprotein export system ATPase subunit